MDHDQPSTAEQAARAAAFEGLAADGQAARRRLAQVPSPRLVELPRGVGDSAGPTSAPPVPPVVSGVRNR